MADPKSPKGPSDPWANFPGGNPFGPGGPLGGKDPFGNDMDAWFRSMGIEPSEFRRMVEEMQKSLQDAFRHMGTDPTKPFVGGFSVKVGPDGKPAFDTFGNKPQVKPNPSAPGGLPVVNADEREPLTDVIEEVDRIAVTMELPGVTREDISLHMTESELEIGVDTEKRKYHKRVKLPAKVDPSTTKATYNNGVLDVTVKKTKAPGGVKIQVT